ncbi:unnamed protein product [Clonostachys byssicola]|uniref:Uncharacterized protein n=1 Tax=Clonostachys byssicola TaxID=160290 RepID=A0A9N9Y2L9_9HYPO|nr:unnamed protein product [Clonostachys byssicola]
MEEKAFIVTGGAYGIGLATVRLLLAQGASVGVGDIQEDALRAAVLPLNSQYCQRVHFIRSFIYRMKEIFRCLNRYANIAGTGGHRLSDNSISETTDTEYNFIMDLNTRTTFIALAEVLRPDIITGKSGSIVCIGSIFGQRGFKRGAAFAASKHAMVGLAKSAVLEAGERGLRINIVEPGAIDTPIHRRNTESNMPDLTPDNPIPRLGTPEDVAGVITFLLGDQSKYVNGAVYAVDGGANA